MGVTRGVTRALALRDTLILCRGRKRRMQCEFCAEQLPGSEPENLALLAHVGESEACNEQFQYLLENLQTSWTPSMSGG